LVLGLPGDEEVSPGGRELDVEVGEVDLRCERGERAGDDAGGKGEQTDRGHFLLHGIPERHSGRFEPT
jgi:hypothetical protein